MKQPCVYILTSKRNGALHVGATSNLAQRVWQRKNHLAAGCTKRYDMHSLVWRESHDTMESAIAFEKALKEWKRKGKLELIERDNPEWQDLHEDPA